ncbi:DNA-binding transcriptional LysR family regulator [Pseudomonas sp. JUb42]|uniref:LysR family transcriptional regulator n=1 Tax=Pseudomonas sp. JUb42 TaxID=2940611 RepID=UPI0021679CA7|nr:LysR family transcriptional regulator [Pseudomonas sp. JUb42]MCS3469955.1 DNA-binding transcriptional LysR family regulator [Pseudomonas sp. JUb42]
MVEIRHIRYFLAVVEHGSVAEAARKLHIAQPALSRQIKDLEEDLGAALFERGARGVSPTIAGQEFATDARAILAALTAAKHRVTHIAKGTKGTLRIGITPNFGWHPKILESIRLFTGEYPDIAVMLDPALSTRQVSRIIEGELDGGFLAWRYPPKDELATPSLQEIRMFECKLRLALPRHSQHAASVPQRLSDLGDEPAVWFPPDVAPAYNDFLTYQCHSVGHTPRKVEIGSDVLTILGLVAAGMGYSIVSDVATHICPEGVVLLEHPDLNMRHYVSFIYRTNDSNPALRRFIDSLEQARDGMFPTQTDDIETRR